MICGCPRASDTTQRINSTNACLIDSQTLFQWLWDNVCELQWSMKHAFVEFILVVSDARGRQIRWTFYSFHIKEFHWNLRSIPWAVRFFFVLFFFSYWYTQSLEDPKSVKRQKTETLWKHFLKHVSLIRITPPCKTITCISDWAIST